MMSPRRGQDDAGAALAIVLAFTALFGLSVAALLGWVTTSFTHARAMGDLADRVYAADAGADYGVSRLRADGDLGITDALCNSSAEPTATYGLTVNGLATSISIEGQPGSGSCTLENGPLNSPAYAILALGAGGIDVRSNGGDITIAGPVHSNGSILAGPRSVTITAADATHPSSATAVLGLGCPAAIVATIEVCGGAAPALDPRLVPGSGAGWALPTDLEPATAGNQADPSSLPARGTSPVACPAGTAATIRCFLPGLYASPPSVTLTSVLYWLQPGYYYFSSGTFTIPKDVAVVAGKLSAGAALPTSVPGACTTSGVEAEHARGAELIFGGTARVSLAHNDSKLEVCAMPWLDRQRIGIYGVHAAPPAGYTANTSTILSTGGDGKGSLRVLGGVYAPAADFDINLKGGGSLEVTRGIVVDELAMKETPPAVIGAPVAAAPARSILETADRRVLIVSQAAEQTARVVVTLDAVTDLPTIESWWVAGPEAG
jgi:hypothetical protein